MNETYTFSRALHLMRYGGKKMRIDLDDEYYFFVNDKEEICCGYIAHPDDTWCMEMVNCYDIMGSWIEVKDKK